MSPQERQNPSAVLSPLDREEHQVENERLHLHWVVRAEQSRADLHKNISFRLLEIMFKNIPKQNPERICDEEFSYALEHADFPDFDLEARFQLQGNDFFSATM